MKSLWLLPYIMGTLIIGAFTVDEPALARCNGFSCIRTERRVHCTGGGFRKRCAAQYRECVKGMQSNSPPETCGPWKNSN